MKILLVQPRSTGFMGQVSRSGKAGFARITLTTLAALVPPEHEVLIHDARLREPDYEENWDLVGFTASGGRYVFIGFESTSDDALKAMRKRFNQPARYLADIRRTAKRVLLGRARILPTAPYSPPNPAIGSWMAEPPGSLVCLSAQGFSLLSPPVQPEKYNCEVIVVDDIA